MRSSEILAVTFERLMSSNNEMWRDIVHPDAVYAKCAIHDVLMLRVSRIRRKDGVPNNMTTFGTGVCRDGGPKQICQACFDQTVKYPNKDPL